MLLLKDRKHFSNIVYNSGIFQETRKSPASQELPRRRKVLSLEEGREGGVSGVSINFKT